MQSKIREHVIDRIKIILEAPESDQKSATSDAKPKEDTDSATSNTDESDDIFTQEEIDSAGESPAESDNKSDKEAPEDTAAPGMAGPDTPISDDEKMRQLFAETGNPEIDYGLTSEANVRLAKFKFKNCGIDPLTMMDEQEQTDGIRVDELESRFTPDQYDLYKNKWKEIRREFPKISEREQKVVIYNSNIPFFYNDDSGNTRNITHKADVITAIDKTNKFMVRNFGEDWVDNKKAIKFLQGIRINFSEDPKIRPNLISAKFFEEYEDRELVAFNKLHADIPDSVRKFLKDNIDMDEFKKSSVFRTLSNDYVGENAGSSRTSVYAVIKGDTAAKEEGTQGDSSEDELNDTEDESQNQSDSTDDESDQSDAEPEETAGEDLGL